LIACKPAMMQDRLFESQQMTKSLSVASTHALPQYWLSWHHATLAGWLTSFASRSVLWAPLLESGSFEFDTSSLHS